jgi:DNA-binding CsgD family transcriptional regulator
MKDIILILYILSFFSGIANMTLNSLSLKSQANDVTKKLLYFNIAFFVYLTVNFGIFFTRLFNQAESMSHLIFSIFDISYVVFIICWVNYADSLAENQQSKLNKNVAISAGFAYVILWAIVYVMYTNDLDRVQGLMGQTLSVIAEVVLFVATLECSIVYIAKSLRMKVEKRKKLLLILSILMPLYFIWFLIYDLDVVLRFIGPSGWFIYPFDAVILLYLSVNIAIIYFGYQALWTKPDVTVSQLDILNIEIAKSLVQEAASKFQLTPREIEVLILMVAGSSNTEISKELTISMYTLKRHINNIFKKTNAKNRHEIVYILKQKG